MKIILLCLKKSNHQEIIRNSIFNKIAIRRNYMKITIVVAIAMKMIE